MQIGGQEYYFWKKVGTPTDTDCWTWLGNRQPSGHGYIQIFRVRWMAHRLSYFINKGEIPEGLNVNHTCDNAWCVNPDHLYAGTQQENMKDVRERGRQAKGEKHGMCKLTQQQVDVIRSSTLTDAELAKHFQVSQSHIWNIKNKKRWV